MKRNRHFLLPALLIGIFLTIPSLAHAMEANTRMSSQFLARGERAVLEIAISGAKPTRFPSIPPIDGVDISPISRRVQPTAHPLRQLEHVFEYQISSYRIGIHEIPAISIDIAGVPIKTQPMSFEVFDPNELQWSETTAGNLTFRYATSFRALNRKPYEGESTPTEIKLYVPRNLLVDDWGIPDFERDGLTAWRFQPSPAKSEVNLLGMEYTGASYPSILTPTRSGIIGIGPAKIRLMTIQAVIDGFIRREIFEAQASVPRLQLEARPLPENAPAGFTNAVGNFGMTIRTEDLEFMEGDPIPVEIQISGTGNLDNLDPPQPIETDGWKVYESARDPRGTEREQSSGTVTFRQFMRPLEIKGRLPPYRFVYFDPTEKTYRTITSEKIPLMIKPAPTTMPTAGTAPVAAGTPVERMTDILSIAQPASLTLVSSTTAVPPWAWHALAGLTAFGLLAKAAWLRLAPRLRRDPHYQIRQAELRDLAQTRDDHTFLMKAGHFIERWLGDRDSADLKTILEQRDLHCFRPDPSPDAAMPPSRKSEIIRILRQAIPLILVSLIFLTPSMNAASPEESLPHRAATAYEEARFDDAIRLWLEAGPYDTLAPDTLFNIGNACYRLGSPGHAALYYRRALLRAPDHMESRQNLRFLERKHGALTIHRPDYQYLISKVRLDLWKHATLAGGWMLMIGLLVFPATRSGSKWRVAGAVACLLGPILATTGALGWYYFPNDARFAPITRQAIVVDTDAIVFAEASRNSSEVIDAPPGSLCEVIRQSGRWSYISFATKTRGWIPSDSIEPIIPTSPPSPPTIRKPKADESSA